MGKAQLSMTASFQVGEQGPSIGEFEGQEENSQGKMEKFEKDAAGYRTADWAPLREHFRMGRSNAKKNHWKR